MEINCFQIHLLYNTKNKITKTKNIMLDFLLNTLTVMAESNNTTFIYKAMRNGSLQY